MFVKILKAVITLAVLAGLWFGWKWYKQKPKQAEITYFRSQVVTKGSVTQEVTATGTIAPIKKVSVTTQVTGKIISLSADYNSRITEGQVIALLDTDTYESSLASARAQLKSNEANLAKTKAQLTLATKELTRQKKLFEREMTTESDLDNAQASYDQLLATIKSNEAAIEQSRASVKTAEKNLADCTINSPVTGIVIDRAVEEGQTVVSSMNATGLFTVATDLKRIQVQAAIPEADIGGIKVGQRVNFTVDAYKTKFVGEVTQIRLASATNSNVVTYPVIIEAENPDERLFPGMTANLSIIIEEADDVVLVPNAATRFLPPGLENSPLPGQRPHGAMRPEMGTSPAGEPLAPPQFAKEGEDSKPPMDQPSENSAIIWIADSDTEIHPVTVELGITDSINTVVLKGGEELLGKNVVVGKQSAASAKAAGDNQQATNPFMPKPPARGGNNRKGAGAPPPRM
ncbi:MAG: efflux RND transporter periplasmic adaptor subunit [Lentisphaeria bacterium]|nr:efflux RND transporter periplasmic adaptor subunit [Lentisphaeria bacterium]